MSENFERLGNYMLLEKLNAGGMAEVYLSKSIGASGVNKFLAIKRILPQFSDNREFIEMFKDEAKIAVNLAHNNVVSIIDFKASRNQLYLVMEYVQGQNLRQILQQKKKKGLSLSLDYIVYLIREVAAGLDYAHRCVDKATGKPLNIIHRDMSPQNIMISYDGEVKIVDFGIAKTEAAGENTRVGTLKGKFSYMSPEQAEGLVIDQVSDIFSLGIILWELIADDRLFIANNEMNILKRIKECDIPDLRRVNPSVPAELERIVKKTLYKDKTLRYQTSADLQKDLTRFLNKEFPDFTPNDFSTFMKFLFESEYLLAQERIVNYSKLDFGSLEYNEPTQLTQSMIFKSPTAFPPPPEPPKGLVTPPLSPPAQSQQNAPEPREDHQEEVINQKLQLPDSPGQATLTGLSYTTGLKRENTYSHNQRIRPISPNSQFATRSGITRAGIRYKAPTKAPVSEGVKAFISFIIVALICYSLYFLSPKKVKLKFHEKLTSIQKLFMDKVFPVPGANKTVNISDQENPRKGPGAESTSNSSTLPPLTFNILIKSNPGRAKIIVDDKDIGMVTPASIPLAANKTVNLTLLADGFLPYTSRFTPVKDDQIVAAELSPIKFGYLNINIINSGVETIIYIDDVEIKEKQPITKYPIPSGRPVRIRAIHPFAGTSAETVVTIGNDEKKTIDLILSKNPGDSFQRDRK